MKDSTSDGFYKPTNFDNDGFIHCTADRESSLCVLADYFSGIPDNEIILILKIDADKLNAEVRYEPPAPVAGTGMTQHIKDDILFPHIYGELNIDAVAGIGKVEKSGEKSFGRMHLKT